MATKGLEALGQHPDYYEGSSVPGHRMPMAHLFAVEWVFTQFCSKTILFYPFNDFRGEWLGYDPFEV